MFWLKEAGKNVLPDMRTESFSLCIHQPIYGYSYLRAFFVHECTDPYHWIQIIMDEYMIDVR